MTSAASKCPSNTVSKQKCNNWFRSIAIIPSALHSSSRGFVRDLNDILTLFEIVNRFEAYINKENFQPQMN